MNSLRLGDRKRDSTQHGTGQGQSGDPRRQPVYVDANDMMTDALTSALAGVIERKGGEAWRGTSVQEHGPCHGSIEVIN